MDVAFVLFPHFTALDVIGPYNVLAYGPEARTHLVAASRQPVRADAGTLQIEPDCTFADLPAPDVVVVPGGPGWRRIAEMDDLVDWLRVADSSAKHLASVCTGAFALAGAGLLDGRKATTHWAALRHLKRFGAIPTQERVVADGRYLTGAGVSAGIDMALTLAGLVWGDSVAEAIQLANEYDPHPPYTAGTPATAPPDVVELIRAQLDSELGVPARG